MSLPLSNEREGRRRRRTTGNRGTDPRSHQEKDTGIGFHQPKHQSFDPQQKNESRLPRPRRRRRKKSTSRFNAILQVFCLSYCKREILNKRSSSSSYRRQELQNQHLFVPRDSNNKNLLRWSPSRFFASVSPRAKVKLLCFAIVLLVSLIIIIPTVLLSPKHWTTESFDPVLMIGASSSSTQKEFETLYWQTRKEVESHHELYQQVYQDALAATATSTERRLPFDSQVNDDKDKERLPDSKHHPLSQQSQQQRTNITSFFSSQNSSYATHVQWCSVTIVMTDPRLGFPITVQEGPQSLWFSLESVGAFAPFDACILLQTASCVMKEHLMASGGVEEQGEASTNNEAVLESIQHSIYRNALPLFRKRIDSGRVRVSILDDEKYNLKSCRDFGNPSSAYMNRFFWQEEFVSGVDSDSVLIIQDDAVLCYPLENLDQIKQYAFVGALWTPKPTPLTPDPMEGACMGMPARWKNWLRPQRRWKKLQQQQSNPELAFVQNKKPVVEPKEILPEAFPNVCDNGEGPLGNGGFSMRSRSWMVRVIETCPHVSHNGLDVTAERLACKVLEQVNEDFYFGTILRGLGAPMPTAYEASLFATEMLWPEQVWDLYGFAAAETEEDSSSSSLLRRRRDEFLHGNGTPLLTGRPQVVVDGRKLTIPNGVHKPWWYHPNTITRSKGVSNGCPFLPYVFTPEQSRWDEATKDVPAWGKVGT